MARTCPHCQASLPPTGDAFCFECGEPLDAPRRPHEPAASPRQIAQPMMDPRRYTFAGRLVILIYGALGVAGTLALMVSLFGVLPAGQYPLFYFAAPFFILGFLLCANTFHLLEKMGVKVYEDRSELLSENKPKGEIR